MSLVTTSRDGADLDLPNDLVLVHREQFMLPYEQESSEDPVRIYELLLWPAWRGAPPDRETESDWLAHFEEMANWIAEWKTHPTTESIWRAMRRSKAVPTSGAVAWGAKHGHDGDVGWYRSRRQPIGSPASLDPLGLAAAVAMLLREAAQREWDRRAELDGPELNLMVEGRLLSQMTTPELEAIHARFLVAVDFHLARGGVAA